ncbi:hypothetical protein A2Z33_03755 [Candidatus Gottesmanbacteria bacterium RBG_16_52_11]|uniref:YYY membrane protein n=1 Tax=Candidatus Gottesmanbacteria bacterium RBG_16_52_11 TaxID=1798374 RepID=A0A1F5YVM4_9BACT|nr:MAG: hypothetical protein A2Z33_03755 [Candidatus Gottesmanbacteria bacterium RBG_16_52_11]
MGPDIAAIVRFWGVLFAVGAAAYPLTRRLFPAWQTRGYLLAKAVGLVTISFIVWTGAHFRIMPFTTVSVVIAAAAVFAVGVAAGRSRGSLKGHKPSVPVAVTAAAIMREEMFFFLAFLTWALVKGHEPSIHGLEKFMDFGFARTILNSTFLPPPDLWWAGGTINYYYFGHYVMALLTKVSGVPLEVTFNLMLAALFAFTLTMSYAIAIMIARTGFAVRGQADEHKHRLPVLLTGVLAALLVTLAGNMQTLYAFTKGYTGEDVKPFWELLWTPAEFPERLTEGLDRYWYANATRFIPFTIHEFPSYSFVVSDIHGHVLSLPFVLLAIAFIIQMFAVRDYGGREDGVSWERPFVYGILVAVLFMTNALDGLIYFGLFVTGALFIPGNGKFRLKQIGATIAPALVAIPAVWPFLNNFSSFVSGLAVNCPPAILANRKIGPFLFETVDKCQKSPVWMMWLLWGFFIFCAVSLFLPALKQLIPGWFGRNRSPAGRQTHGNVMDKLLALIFLYCLGLIIFPEFFYFKDIYPAHFRSNTMFKLGYQAFIMFSLISSYAISTVIFNKGIARSSGKKIGRVIFACLLIPQLFLVSIYPLFSVRSYFDSLKTWRSLNGFRWLREEYPDDAAGIAWLEAHAEDDMRRATVNPDCYIFSDARTIPRQLCSRTLPVVAEADGDSYTDYARVSAFTGVPTVIGWPVHEWLWRGSYDIVAPRREDVRVLYEDDSPAKTADVIARYNITYVFVGTLERQKFERLNEDKFRRIGRQVFSQGQTAVYQIP